MSEETLAASSPAEVEDVFRGENVSLAEFSAYRKEGELPERFKPTAESEPADTPEETAPEGDEPETEPDSEPEETQEPPAKGAEKRIKQLLAKTKELEAKLAAKQDGKPESSPAPEPQTRTKPTAEDKKPDGTPKYSTYEDFVEDLADWKAEQRWEAAKREQAQQEAQKAFQNELDDARARYENFDEVVGPFAKAINTDSRIPSAIRQMFLDSDVTPDLLFTIGSDEAESAKFLKLAKEEPGKAIRYLAKTEDLIIQELSSKEKSKDETPRDAKGKFTAPEPKKTAAPKPPSPVGGASSRAFDVSDESLSPEEWARKRNQDVQKRRS